MCYLLYAAHHFNAVQLPHFPSLPTILFYDVIHSKTSGRRHWRTYLWVCVALRTHWFCYQQTCIDSSMFFIKHSVADTVCPFNWWSWQCQTLMNRFKSTNFPSGDVAPFLTSVTEAYFGSTFLDTSSSLTLLSSLEVSRRLCCTGSIPWHGVSLTHLPFHYRVWKQLQLLEVCSYFGALW